MLSHRGFNNCIGTSAAFIDEELKKPKMLVLLCTILAASLLGLVAKRRPLEEDDFLMSC